MDNFYKPVLLGEWLKTHDQNWASVTLISSDGTNIVSMFEGKANLGYFWSTLTLSNEDHLGTCRILGNHGGLWGPAEFEEGRFLNNPNSNEWVHTVKDCLWNVLNATTVPYNTRYFVITENSMWFTSDDMHQLIDLFDVRPSEIYEYIHKIREVIAPVEKEDINRDCEL